LSSDHVELVGIRVLVYSDRGRRPAGDTNRGGKHAREVRARAGLSVQGDFLLVNGQDRVGTTSLPKAHRDAVQVVSEADVGQLYIQVLI